MGEIGNMSNNEQNGDMGNDAARGSNRSDCARSHGGSCADALGIGNPIVSGEERCIQPILYTGAAMPSAEDAKNLKLTGALKGESVREEAPEELSLITGRPLKTPFSMESRTEVRDRTSGMAAVVWRKADKVDCALEGDILKVFDSVNGLGMDIEKLVRTIGSIDGVVRVQITDADGCGVVSYF